MKLKFLSKKIILSLFLIIILIIPCLFLMIKTIQILDILELKLIDIRFQARPQIKPTKQIVIIAIDNASIDKLNAWPWPRSYYGKVIEILNKYQAKVIAFDIILDSESLSPKEDDLLAESLQKYPNVILASKIYSEKKENFNVFTWSVPLKKFRPFCQYGYANPMLDKDNTVRHAQLFIKESDNQINFSFDMQILRQYFNLKNMPDIAIKQKIMPLKKEHLIPFETKNGYMKINYTGQEFQKIPFYQILEERYPKMEELKDKIILIGATDPILHDFFMTPFGQMYGVEIHANILQTILENRYLKPVHPLINILLTLCLIGLIGWLSFKLKPIKGFCTTLIVLLLYSAAIIITFLKFSYLINWSYGLVLGFTVYVIILLIRFIKEEQAKRFIKNMFEQYVAPSVVEELIKNPALLKLGGEKRILTVFFSDIRSFTTYSESHTPEQVVEILNEYLDAMTKVIFKWNGTLDKYVGDEIMAIWSAPLPQENHAELAVRCCWEQLAELKKLQEKWISQGRAILDIGMGLNTGEMITGNIGSSMHKDFTVIGDAVNLGARLEAETRHYGTKETPCHLIISEFTYEYVKKIVKVNYLGSVTVKGKTKPVDIYEVLDVS